MFVHIISFLLSSESRNRERERERSGRLYFDNNHLGVRKMYLLIGGKREECSFFLKYNLNLKMGRCVFFMWFLYL